MARSALVPAPEHTLELDSAREDRAVAAWRGALGAGLPALALSAGAVLCVPLVYSAATGLALGLLPALLAEPLMEALFLGSTALLALPVAAVAGGLVRQFARRDPEHGRAAAAGVGMVTSLVAGGAVLSQVTGLVSMVELGPAFAAAMLATGMVGSAAFRAAPTPRAGSDRVPALYTASTAAGLSAAALIAVAGTVDWLSLTFPLLDLPRWALYQALPHPLNDAASIAMVLAVLAPITWGITRTLRAVLPGDRGGAVEVGIALTTLSPVVSILALALSHCLASPGAAVNHLFIAAGAMLGAAPNLLAMRLAMRDDDEPERLPEA